MSFESEISEQELLETIPPLRLFKKKFTPKSPTVTVEEPQPPDVLQIPEAVVEAVEAKEDKIGLLIEEWVVSDEAKAAEAAEAVVDAALKAVATPTAPECEKCEVMHQFMLELLEVKDTPLPECVDRLVTQWDEARQEVARLTKQAQIMTKELNKKDSALLVFEEVVKEKDMEQMVLETRHKEALHRLYLFERLVDEVSRSYGLEKDIQSCWRVLKGY